MTIYESQVIIGTSVTRQRYERTSVFCIDCVTVRSDTTSSWSSITVYDEHPTSDNIWYAPGYGTEKVGPFLKSLVNMTRPQRILELGMGFTTPFLLNGLKGMMEGTVWDGNCDPEYLKKPFDPKFVVVDDISMEKNSSDDRITLMKQEELVEFIEGDFRHPNVMKRVRESGPYDLVWIDCGGPEEYHFFVYNYWNMVKEYALFHFTYFRGEPNNNNEILSKALTTPHNYTYRMDILEPHKIRQGSITMFRKT